MTTKAVFDDNLVDLTVTYTAKGLNHTAHLAMVARDYRIACHDYMCPEPHTPDHYQWLRQRGAIQSYAPDATGPLAELTCYAQDKDGLIVSAASLCYSPRKPDLRFPYQLNAARLVRLNEQTRHTNTGKPDPR